MSGLNSISTFIGFILGCIGLFMYFLAPIKETLVSIQKELQSLGDQSAEIKKELGDLRERIAVVEQSSKSAHNRIDEINDKRGSR